MAAAQVRYLAVAQSVHKQMVTSNYIRAGLLIGVLLQFLSLEDLRAQSLGGLSVGSAPVAETNAPTRLPAGNEQLATMVLRIEAQLAAVRSQRTAAAPEATPEDTAERQRILHQWAIALDAELRSLRRLTEVRELNQDRLNEAKTWSGFEEKPPYPLSLVERLRDDLATQGLGAQTQELMLSIAVNGVTRGAALLENARKQLRLARDKAELSGAPDARAKWLLGLAETRVQSCEAMVESAELDRLVTLESLGGQRNYIEFLTRKLNMAQSQSRFSQEDLDDVLARLGKRREECRAELGEAITKDAEIRKVLASAREKLRQAQQSPGTSTSQLNDLRGAVDVTQAQAETSEFKVELLRSVLVIADYGETLWRDRFWATGDHPLIELRAKRELHQAGLEQLQPWKKFAELKLTAATSQALAETVRESSPNLSPMDLGIAKQLRTASEEQAMLCQRALTAIAWVETASERLINALAQREASMSLSGKTQFLLDGTASLFRRIWDTELYIAEEAVIADGQKISVPRIITIGKVAIALGIFLTGLMVARWVHAVVRGSTSRWLRAGERTSGVSAKVVTGLVAFLAFVVAMASVRIPWAVFAFVGGALAIGVGFGAQNLINNFISGVILFFERSIRVGDIVEVDDQVGRVVDVGFRNSLIKRRDGVEVLVPNSQFLEKKVVNWTLTDDLVRYKINVGVAYGSPPAKVTSILSAAAAKHPLVLHSPSPQVLFEDFGDSALMFSLVFWVRLGPGVDGGVVRSELRHLIHTLLEQESIPIPFPQRDIHFDSTRPLEVRVTNAPADTSRDSRL
jgi:small-conductance mechanosensitive channel